GEVRQVVGTQAADRALGRRGRRAAQAVSRRRPKMNSRSLLIAAVAMATILPDAGNAGAADGFDIVSLGALGGIQDGNLSAYLVHPHDDDRAVTFDAGTLVNGLRAADEKGAFNDVKVPADSALG